MQENGNNMLSAHSGIKLGINNRNKKKPSKWKLKKKTHTQIPYGSKEVIIKKNEALRNFDEI